ncbi:MAG: hypothetical protein R2874_10815 [Desulfobacterales bacterium]
MCWQLLGNAMDFYKKAGAELVDVSLPHSRYAVAAYYRDRPGRSGFNGQI